MHRFISLLMFKARRRYSIKSSFDSNPATKAVYVAKNEPANRTKVLLAGRG